MDNRYELTQRGQVVGGVGKLEGGWYGIALIDGKFLEVTEGRLTRWCAQMWVTAAVGKGKWEKADQECRCGHSKEAHQHYRQASDCALCGCVKFRRLWWFHNETPAHLELMEN